MFLRSEYTIIGDKKGGKGSEGLKNEFFLLSE